MSKLVEAIKEDEGYSQFIYKCPADKWSIAHGLNVDPDGSGIGISKEMAEVLLRDALENLQYNLIMKFPQFMDLSEVRQDVLMMMAYQMGLTGLMKFKKTLKYVMQGKYKKASIEMLDSKWAAQTPARAIRLSQMMESDKYGG